MNDEIKNIKDWLAGMTDSQLSTTLKQCVESDDGWAEEMVRAEIRKRIQRNLS